MKNLIAYVILCALLISSCGIINKDEVLTEEQVINYIETYKSLKEKAPEILQQVNQNPQNSDIGIEKFGEIENIIQDGGFRSYTEFVIVNTKIGVIFSLLQANTSTQTFEGLQQWGNDAAESGIAEYEHLIADPNISEDLKNEYRKAMVELKKTQNQINDEYAANKKWADLVLEGAEKIKNLIVTEEDVELVKKYETQIYEAYTGFPKPELPSNEFPEIDFGY